MNYSTLGPTFSTHRTALPWNTQIFCSSTIAINRPLQYGEHQAYEEEKTDTVSKVRKCVRGDSTFGCARLPAYRALVETSSRCPCHFSSINYKNFGRKFVILFSCLPSMFTSVFPGLDVARFGWNEMRLHFRMLWVVFGPVHTHLNIFINAYFFLIVFGLTLHKTNKKPLQSEDFKTLDSMKTVIFCFLTTKDSSCEAAMCADSMAAKCKCHL